MKRLVLLALASSVLPALAVPVHYVSDAHGAEIRFQSPKGLERIRVTELPQAQDVFHDFFSGFGLMYLVSPYLPAAIETDFPVNPEVVDLMDAMYVSLGKPPPKLRVLAPQRFPVGNYRRYRTKKGRLAVAYSAGKDSMWNLMRAEEQVGPENVFAVHLSGLNRSVAGYERDATLAQAKAFPIHHLKVVPLENSSRNANYDVMRARDLFLLALGIPYALDFGASELWTEGFAEELDDELFSGREATMHAFNAALQRLRLPMQIGWKNATELQCLEDLLERRPKWMPYVCNCFSAPCYRPPLFANWRERAPSFPLYRYQCGSCVKCRLVSVARINHGVRGLTPVDAAAIHRNFVAWRREKEKDGGLENFLTPSFLAGYDECLARLLAASQHR